MIITSDYSLVLKEDVSVFVESYEHIYVLNLSVYVYLSGFMYHIRKKESGVKEQLVIRRFHCKNCHSYHSELPDCIVPYKHYEMKVISGILNNVIKLDDLDYEDYEPFASLFRWLR